MSSQVTLPRLGQGMETGTIVRWLKSEGETVEKGEPLYELDTEKVTQEVEAESSGVLLKILAGEGEEIEVGKTIAVIGEAGEELRVPEAAPAWPDQEEEPRAEAAPAAMPEPAPTASVGTANGGRIKASPLARRIARERGVELSGLRGTGPEGRIVAEDVERTAASGRGVVEPSPTERVTERETVVRLNQMRKTIARLERERAAAQKQTG
jgi:pyruvate dehydrogenase E2 component (dihydrolipoamide acetyltransferase)